MNLIRVFHAINWLYKQAMGPSNEKENYEAIQIADPSPLRVLPKYELLSRSKKSQSEVAFDARNLLGETD